GAPPRLDSVDHVPTPSVEHFPSSAVRELAGWHVDSAPVLGDRHAVDPEWIAAVPDNMTGDEIELEQRSIPRTAVGAVADEQHVRSTVPRHTPNAAQLGERDCVDLPAAVADVVDDNRLIYEDVHELAWFARSRG